MVAKRPTRSTAKKTAARTPVGRAPRTSNSDPVARAAKTIGRSLSARNDRRKRELAARKDVAVLRTTHAGCPDCHGTGTVYTQAKDGSFNGSKPCKTKPSNIRVSRWQITKEARFGRNKSLGLYGWHCPCGKKEKAKYRSSGDAQKAITVHEKRTHAAHTIGATWFREGPDTPAPLLAPATPPVAKPAPAKKTTPGKAPRPAAPRAKAAPKAKPGPAPTEKIPPARNGGWLLTVTSTTGQPIPGAFATTAGVAVYDRADLYARLDAARGRTDVKVSVTSLPKT
jgi:hypothetical protein